MEVTGSTERHPGGTLPYFRCTRIYYTILVRALQDPLLCVLDIRFLQLFLGYAAIEVCCCWLMYTSVPFVDGMYVRTYAGRIDSFVRLV